MATNEILILLQETIDFAAIILLQIILLVNLN